MRGKTRAAVVAGLSVTTLLAACGGGGNGGSTGSSGGGEGGQGGGSITVRGCNPENPLIPGNTNESCGGNILDMSVATLVHYKSEDATPENDLAEAIETSDNQNFTVKLKKGQMFADGTEVKAKNFVDAWNYNVANALLNEYFFAPIEGYEDVKPGEDPDGEKGPQTAPPSKAKEMSGLKVVDDHTFTIKTSQQVSNLPIRLGYRGFAPLPDAFFKDPKAFGDKPVGAGPYTVESWTKNQEIKLVRNPHYKGAYNGKVDNITFRIFQNDEAAYNEVVANNLDVTDTIPPSALIGDRYKQELANRQSQDDSGGIQTITFATEKNSPELKNPKLRQAISMAIDRKAITDKIFQKTREPADGWVSPAVQGYKQAQCGEYCTYDPAKAKAKLAEAGGFTGRLTLGYNADSAHKDWTEATCISIKNALGIECVATPTTDFATFRASINQKKIKGMFRSGWIMDYPSIENFLTPLYATGASSNDGDYSNPKFDAKLKEAAAAKDLESANKLYQEAESMLKEDMPAIPLWYYKIDFGWSDKVDNVKATRVNTVDYTQVTVKQ